MASIYDFSLRTLDGKPLDLAACKGKVALLVNTASKCGLTPQYAGLEALHREFGDRGLAVIGFPCNQFGAQEPGDAAEISDFCDKNYGVGFTLSEKIEVNGEGTAPLYRYLRENAPAETMSEGSGKLIEILQKINPEALIGNAIKWNFTKFLVDREGRIVARFDPTTAPEAIQPAIEALL
ncbi:MAG: glutathione peroxidase [Proteobacteria bacterium]|nr:glutathione peroxidase [Pseudomonadota bacterium]HQR03295.1 glutathione peroxidase [Rhodocyclaceae bacterium]